MASTRLKWPRQFEGHLPRLEAIHRPKAFSHLSPQTLAVLQITLDCRMLAVLDGLADVAGTTPNDLAMSVTFSPAAARSRASRTSFGVSRLAPFFPAMTRA